MIVNEIFSKQQIMETVMPEMMSEAKKSELARRAKYQILDMTVLFYMPLIFENKKDFGKVVVTHEMIGKCGITVSELYEAACKNVEKKATIKSMASVIGEMIGTDMDLPEMDMDVLVISNTSGCLGAASILNKNVMSQVRAKLKNFVLLPSSIHEFLAVPYDSNIGIEGYRSMVQDVNQTVVDKEDRLSDNVYEWVNGILQFAK